MWDPWWGAGELMGKKEPHQKLEIERGRKKRKAYWKKIEMVGKKVKMSQPLAPELSILKWLILWCVNFTLIKAGKCIQGVYIH